MKPNGEFPSRAQIDVLRAIAETGTIAAAAKRLHLSPHTVDGHLDVLRAATGLRHLPQLMVWAAREGLIPDREPGQGKPQAAETEGEGQGQAPRACREKQPDLAVAGGEQSLQ